jgi:hypothetical protein
LSTIIIVCSDLIFKTKIDSILQSKNLDSIKYTDFNSVDFESLSESPYLIIVDLEIENTDFSLILEKKKLFGKKINLLGYCSHVLTELIQKANAAGFDEVMPKSKFVKILPDILNNFDKHNK